MPLWADPWELSAALSRVLLYFGLSGAAGGIFVSWLIYRASGTDTAGRTPESSVQPFIQLFNQRFLFRYVLVCSVAGLTAVVLNFLLQVGEINQRGLNGMLDAAMASILAQSSVGHGSALRLAGFLLLITSSFFLFKARFSASGPLGIVLFAGSAILIGSSFGVLGHVANLGIPAKILIAVHVVAFALWAGSLLPLHRLSIAGVDALRDLDQLQPLQQLQRRVLGEFGQFAALIVALLIIAGSYLAFQFLNRIGDLVDTSYGLVLSIKLGTVALLLALAALNRFKLVPLLPAGRSYRLLKRSISGEILLVLLIWLLTAFLTTAVGPPARS